MFINAVSAGNSLIRLCLWGVWSPKASLGKNTSTFFFSVMYCERTKLNNFWYPEDCWIKAVSDLFWHPNDQVMLCCLQFPCKQHHIVYFWIFYILLKLISVWMFNTVWGQYDFLFKKVSYDHQRCIYLINNTVKNSNIVKYNYNLIQLFFYFDLY